MNTTELQQQFGHAKLANEFTSARTTWNANQAQACIFFRPSWRIREAAYALAMYLYPKSAAYVAVCESLDSALTVIRQHGYAEEQWQELDRSLCHLHIAPIDQEPLWNAGYGVVRKRGISTAEWLETTITPAESKESLSGKKLDETGLGYWIAPADEFEPAWYVPVHLLSGYCCGEKFYSEEVCQQYLQELATLMKDWNQPREALIKDPEYQPEQFEALAKKFWIEDAGVTAGGGRW